MFKQSLIAIDFGSSAIKVAELSGRASKTLRAIGLETLPPSTIIDGAIQAQDDVEKTLVELLKKLKIGTRGRRAAISLGGSAVKIKKIDVPVSKDTDIAEQVFYEAEQHFEQDMSDIYFDFWKLSPGPNENGEQPVLLIGAKRDIVEQYISCLRGAGLRTGVVDCDVIAVANMFEYNYGVVEGLVALINVGASNCQVSILYNGMHMYTRDVSVAGEEYTVQIAGALGLEHNSAESLKIDASLGATESNEDLHRIISEVNEQLVSEIKMTFDYFFRNEDLAVEQSIINHVFLTGGGCRVLGLDGAMATALEIPIHIVNPFQRIEVSPKKFDMDYLLMQGHVYGVSAGLGMRGMSDGN